MGTKIEINDSSTYVGFDAKKACSIFIEGEVGTSLLILPQALNPFLRAVESLGMWTQLFITALTDSNGKAIYLVVKKNKESNIKEIVLE